MMRRHLGVSIAATAVALAGVSGFGSRAMADACGTVVGNPTDGLVTNIIVDTVWGGGANPSPICLEEPIYIGAPAVLDPAILTILPGTIVRGQPRRGATGTVDNNAGSLVVTQDSTIIAEGTPTSPIIMTTAAVDNDNDGACDNLDRGLGNTFKDPFPGLDPNIPAGCAATETCTTPCTGGCVPLFCDDTPASAPLAPLDTALEPNVQLWGGLAIVGNAPTNLEDDEGVGYGRGVLEGINIPATPVANATYGGVEPHDNSGIVKYVSVRHAGDPLIANNELNGVSLGGVGDGTVYEYVEVYTNWDDGHEWFGGTVNGSHLVTLYAGDDQFDLDEGYTGALQFLFTAMPFFNAAGGSSYGSGSGDRMGEWDNVNAANTNIRIPADAVLLTDDDPTPWPMGHPYIWNLTGIGSTPDVNPAAFPASANRGLFMTAAFSGQVLNSIIVNTGANSCVECDAGGGVLGMTCPTNATADQVRLVASICADTGAPNATVAANGDAYAERITGDAVSYDNISTASDVLVAEDAAGFTGAGGADGKLPTIGVTAYDPRPTGTELGLTPQDTGLDRSATYRGAFEHGAAELWTTGWTAGNAAGLIAD
jgi:hypothetical protein